MTLPCSITMIEFAFNKTSQAVRDDDHGPPLRNALEVRADHGLAVRIERAGCFVQDQNARIVDQRPSNREPLSLSARKVRRPFFDVSLVTIRHDSR